MTDFLLFLLFLPCLISHILLFLPQLVGRKLF